MRRVSVEAMIARVLDEYNRLDALINNAGVADFGPLGETDFERWRTVMATNLDGVFLCPQAALAMAVHTPDIISAYHDAIPLNRYGTEQEIANVIVFLCSDKASYITGQAISFDGGFQSTGVGLPALRSTE